MQVPLRDTCSSALGTARATINGDPEVGKADDEARMKPHIVTTRNVNGQREVPAGGHRWGLSHGHGHGTPSSQRLTSPGDVPVV